MGTPELGGFNCLVTGGHRPFWLVSKRMERRILLQVRITLAISWVQIITIHKLAELTEIELQDVLQKERKLK